MVQNAAVEPSPWLKFLGENAVPGTAFPHDDPSGMWVPEDHIDGDPEQRRVKIASGFYAEHSQAEGHARAAELAAGRAAEAEAARLAAAEAHEAEMAASAKRVSDEARAIAEQVKADAVAAAVAAAEAILAANRPAEEA